MPPDIPIQSDIGPVKSTDDPVELQPEHLASHHGRTRQPTLGDGVLLEKSRRGNVGFYLLRSP
jgi:hypothetical protein